ncbi:hypothetical protein PIB30_073785, partial [Stylosanthes scabra]|nr:hypothetical protein [Stylosanthes scabra]
DPASLSSKTFAPSLPPSAEGTCTKPENTVSENACWIIVCVFYSWWPCLHKRRSCLRRYLITSLSEGSGSLPIIADGNGTVAIDGWACGEGGCCSTCAASGISLPRRTLGCTPFQFP